MAIKTKKKKEKKEKRKKEDIYMYIYIHIYFILFFMAIKENIILQSDSIMNNIDQHKVPYNICIMKLNLN